MTAHTRIRRLIDGAAALSGLLGRAEAAMRRSLTILTYHRILPAEAVPMYPFPSLAVPVDVFRAQVQWLAGACRVLPVGEALRILASGGADRPLVALTFDDGYADNFADAAPILEEHGVRGTFFVTVDAVARGETLWFDRAALAWGHAGRAALERAVAEHAPDAAKAFPASLGGWIDLLRALGAERTLALLAALDRTAPPPAGTAAGFRLMAPGDAATLAARGHEVASHTLSHPFLTALDPAALAEELSGSRRTLAGWLGQRVDGFCYPAGDHDARVVEAVRAAGYRWACSTEEGTNRPGADPHLLRRNDVTCHRTTGPALEHDALGFRMEVSGLRHRTRRLIGRAP